MPAFYLFLKELMKIAALTDPDSFPKKPQYKICKGFFFIKYSKNGFFWFSHQIRQLIYTVA